MAEDIGVTVEFLEKSLGFPVEKFHLKPGACLGEGYTCVLHSLTVWKKVTTDNTASAEPLNIVIKCYPSNPTRQEFLESSNIFSTELRVYNEVIPELYRFQEDLNLPKIVEPPFGKLIYGRCVDAEAKKKLGRPMETMDNCIIMPDLRTPENGGYGLRDRFLGLDLDHYRLVIEAQARLHALSWAYKCVTGIGSLVDRFPFTGMDDSQMETWKSMSAFVFSLFDSASDMFADNERIVTALKDLKQRYYCVVGLYFDLEMGQKDAGYTKDTILKRPEPAVGTEEPWLVLLHGDAWSNNMMFRYDEKTGRPVQVLFVDLQITREGDPMADLAYTLCCSTQKDMRSKHLESMLHVYYDTFTQVCKRLSVPTLPGFTWQEFNRRFRRAKIVGACFAVFALPIMLKNPEELVDMDKIQVDETNRSKDIGENLGELFSHLSSSKSANPVLELRLKGVLEDLIEDDII